MVRLLLRYGARVDLRDDSNHETQLLVAARSGAVKIARDLIAAGSDVNAVDSLGGNAVAIAAGAKQEETVKLFISQGVDPCARDREERNALYWANFGSDGDPQKPRIVALLESRCGSYDLPAALAAMVESATLADSTPSFFPRAQKER